MSVAFEERFWAKVDRSGDCWIWLGSRTKTGYGRVKEDRGRRVLLAHRVAWELERGAIPAGLVVDHLCRQTSCVNPDHLEPVTQRVNMNRGYGGSISAAMQRAKTHCPHGHEYSPDNIYWSNGGRSCRRCNLDRSIRLRAERRAVA